VFVLFVGLAILILFASNPTPIKAAWVEFERIILLKSDALPASPPKLSDHEIDALSAMAPQQRAELLMERSINHYGGAIERLDKDVLGWYGQLEVQNGPLAGLLNTAINSNDLRVRAAALEIYLAGYDLHKTPESVDKLLSRLQNEPEQRAWLLWMLGVLGNRGVQTARIQAVFQDRLHDPDELTRSSAVVGLGLLGTNNAVAPLFAALRDDPSPHVREVAAYSIAQSGMFQPEQRLGAVPALVKTLDDPKLDPTTRSCAVQALRDITGANLGSDPAAWRNWWSHRSRG
jgi:hypothetical protein